MGNKQNKPSTDSANIVDAAKSGDIAVPIDDSTNIVDAAKTGNIEVRSLSESKEHTVYFMRLKK